MTSQPTQQATQPLGMPPRHVKNFSDMSEDDLTDVLCTLHANSPCANIAVQATMLAEPEHILQNEDLEGGVTEEDLRIYPELTRRTREIALRMSSAVKNPREGFKFGRSPQLCDILLTDNPRDKLVSGVHFRIFVHEQGSLMIEDLSTNGTHLDNELLKSKDRNGKPMMKHVRRVLKNGHIITVLVGDKQEIKFMVRIPLRTGREAVYEQKLRKYLQVRGMNANFPLIRENSFGNYWSGGETYDFVGLLGKGAFAVVYRVQAKVDGTIRAAKEIDKRRYIKNGVLDIKFDNELQIMKRLRHPNIVDYVDYHEYEDWVYIIMEYVPYGELAKELQTRGRLPEPEVQQITKQTLRALEYLHRQGITHRDIKPDNILIASRDPLKIKLSDFGLSKAVDADRDTFLKTFCGTLLYCAPEVYPGYSTYTQPVKRRRHSDQGGKTLPYSSSADMWSFGAVVFHLLCGHPPVTGRGDHGGQQMLNNIMTRQIDYDPLRRAGVSEQAVEFVNGLLDKRPDKRMEESACFKHAWLRDVPDLVDYSDVSDLDEGNLLSKVVEEEEYDGEEQAEALLQELAQFAENPAMIPPELPKSSASPNRPIKKPRTNRAEDSIPERISYPHLSATNQSSGGGPAANKLPVLFGEITPSLLKSSGVFGLQQQPPIAEPVSPLPKYNTQDPSIPEVQSQLQQVSMNDFANSNRQVFRQQQLLPIALQQSAANVSYVQPIVHGSAASLMGAEAQMDQMNMDEPEEAVASDIPTPETTNPVTPQNFDASPPHSISQPDDPVQNLDPSFRDLQARKINVDLISNEVAFAAEQRIRNQIREVNRRKAETFHVHSNYTYPNVRAMDFAQTFAGPATTIRALSNVENTGNHSGSSTKTEDLRRVNSDVYTFSTLDDMDYLGRLTPTPESFDQEPVTLRERSTLWGRSPQCNVQFRDVKDVRVPKFGMKIVFFAPGVEQVELNGGDWTTVPRIRTIIATSATRGIKINGVYLAQTSDNGEAALFGRLYTGDIITIFEHDNPVEELKYHVEILFGDSALPRPEDEWPFRVQKEYRSLARHKEELLKGSQRQEEPRLEARSL